MHRSRQWIPAEQIEDAATASRMGLPQDLEFATKGQLATQILAQTHADGLVFGFVCGDEVYGSSPDLRRYMEEGRPCSPVGTSAGDLPRAQA